MFFLWNSIILDFYLTTFDVSTRWTLERLWNIAKNEYKRAEQSLLAIDHDGGAREMMCSSAQHLAITFAFSVHTKSRANSETQYDAILSFGWWDPRTLQIAIGGKRSINIDFLFFFSNCSFEPPLSEIDNASAAVTKLLLNLANWTVV